ncbi:MAG: type II toxin-antitoxin system VapC family toxin [Acidaminococcaceae bacterium]|nr:type II toxin-antitoxin system VapC family toxin [Acidaminococcaceae bacterium]MBQ5344632.1 type II toxin-antitoxin system VapC family toxin [Acidaminococcaceae bacterium]
MIRYMLDTNTIAYAKNRRPASVLERLIQHDPSEICISAITMAELEFGISHSAKPSQNRKALLMFLSGITILPFGPEAAQAYGEIRHTLQSQGQLIGANDLLIAAHAKTAGLILVTHNTREFSRVEGLKIEDWATTQP